MEDYIPDPSCPNWQPVEVVKRVLTLKQNHQLNHRFGPFVLLLGDSWKSIVSDKYLPGDKTLLERLQQIDGITDVKHSPDLHGWDVQLDEVPELFEQFIPEGHYIVEDADGERFVRKDKT